jgi:hydrogenase 3 maturation protease
MSTSSWRKWLKTTLARESAPNKSPRIAVVGVGNELNGDDAAGVLAARRLHRKLDKTAGSDRILVVEAGLAPENFSGVLRRFRPEIVILLDAVWFDGKAGATVLLEGGQLAGFGASTHLQPLSTLAGFLKEELGCEVWLIGIQPQHLDFGRPMSAAVRNACRRLAAGLADEMMIAGTR